MSRIRIKTREKGKDIKVPDKSAVVSARMKKALLRTKKKTQRDTGEEQSAPNTYADDQVLSAAEQISRNTAQTVALGREAAKSRFKEYRAKILRRGAADEVFPSDDPTVFTNSREIQEDSVKRPSNEHSGVCGAAPSFGDDHAAEQGRQLTIQNAEQLARRPRFLSANCSMKDEPQPKDKSTIRQRAAEKPRMKKASAKSLPKKQTVIKTAGPEFQPGPAVPVPEKVMKPLAPTMSWHERSNETAAKWIKEASGKTLHAIMAAGQKLTSAMMASGCVTVMLVIVICLIGLLVASPFGVFFSGENSGTGYTMSDAITILNQEFTQAIEQIKTEHPHDILEMENAGSAAMISNWDDVLAIYAVRTTTKDDAVEVATMTEEKLEVLREIFWDMNGISYETETVEDQENGYSTVLRISVVTKECMTMASEYFFDRDQRKLLEELMQPEYVELFQLLTGSYREITLSDVEVAEILARLPENLSEERKAVVLTAFQLLGKVDYFWGGKSLVFGWDSRWGMPMKVTSPGSKTTGTIRPFGLDCSGFVDWVFYNATEGAYIPSGGNGGTSAQRNVCTDIEWSEVLPGDLVFYPRDSHVGIVCGFDENGEILVIHCASGWDTVVLTGKESFISAGRLDRYE